MKSSLYFLALITIAFLIGCDNNNQQKPLIGKWQSTDDSNTVIEFTESGEYHLWINGESFTEKFEENTEPIKYNYLPDEKICNLKLIDEDSEKPTTLINLVFVQQNIIKLSPISKNKLTSERTFTKVKDFEKK